MLCNVQVVCVTKEYSEKGQDAISILSDEYIQLQIIMGVDNWEH